MPSWSEFGLRRRHSNQFESGCLEQLAVFGLEQYQKQAEV